MPRSFHVPFTILQRSSTSCGPDCRFVALYPQEGALALYGSQKVIFESHVTFEDNVMEVRHYLLPEEQL